MKKERHYHWAVLLMIIMASFLLSGCVPDSPQNLGGNPSGGNIGTNSPNVKPENTLQVTLYYSTKDALYLQPIQKNIAKKETWLEDAVSLLATPETDLAPTLPFKNFVESIRIDGTTAYVNIKAETIQKSPKGATLEQLAIQSIVYTIVKNTNVKNVMFTVDKKTKETLLGHVDILDPIEPDNSMIKK